MLIYGEPIKDVARVASDAIKFWHTAYKTAQWAGQHRGRCNSQAWRLTSEWTRATVAV